MIMDKRSRNQFEFGSKSYVKGSKQCLMCDLCIITEKGNLCLFEENPHHPDCQLI